MTALAAYERLEAEGRFAVRPGAPEREVLVKFGDASLMIMTFDETPIDHWPLASLVRARDGKAELSLAPDDGAEDRLRIDDPAMVAAILEVCPDLTRPPASPLARLKRPLKLAAAAVAGAALLWGAWAAAPLALDRLAAGLPKAARAALGDGAAEAYAAGRLCDSPAARRALAPLADRLSRGMGGAPVAIRVADVPQPPAPAVAGPGGRVVLFRATLDKAASPGDVAQAAALALTRTPDLALTQATVRAAGVLGGISVIRGDLAAPRLAEAAAALMAAPGPDDPVGAAALLVAAGLAAESAGAAIPPAGWRALKAVCEK
jgi:hypothetical protein